MVRRAVAEFLGTAFLLSAIIGSGIMAERLAGGNIAIALLANTIATGAVLIALILAFGPISGAHFNPVVSFGLALRSEMTWRELLVYLSAQIGGAFLGVAVAHVMFGYSFFFASVHARSGAPQLFSPNFRVGEVVNRAQQEIRWRAEIGIEDRYELSRGGF